ncbi:MAG: glycosyltransferase family 4 protein [Chloroflexi bacterium]|nr:glycosyltransferase family 4 protein [Chloroflexota bacterium]
MAEHIAEGLVCAGHEVTVITSFPSKMKGELFPGFRRTLASMTRNPKGYRLCRVFTIFSKESAILSRLSENLSYAVASNLASMWFGRPDVIYMNTWPAIATFVTAVVCTLRRIPFVYNVQDLYPESASGLGYVREQGLVYRILHRMDCFTSSHAARIVAISEEFAERIRRTRKIPSDRIAVIWNWYDACVVPSEKWGELRASIAPAPESCVVMYAGNIGSVAGLESVLDAAERLASKGDYVFVLAGDGTLRQQLEQNCVRRSVTNVRFYYPLHREDLGRVQAAADILLITAKTGLALSEVPSKIMGYMLSGRPVLAMVDKESNTARVVQQANCGCIGTPEDPQALADLVEQMMKSGRLDEWGRNARIFAENHFDQTKGVAKIVNLISSAIAQGEKR